MGCRCGGTRVKGGDGIGGVGRRSGVGSGHVGHRGTGRGDTGPPGVGTRAGWRSARGGIRIGPGRGGTGPVPVRPQPSPLAGLAPSVLLLRDLRGPRRAGPAGGSRRGGIFSGSAGGCSAPTGPWPMARARRQAASPELQGRGAGSEPVQHLGWAESGSRGPWAELSRDLWRCLGRVPEESPSTVSTTPDSTDGGNDESDFPELQTAREFSEDEEEETSLDWGTPRGALTPSLPASPPRGVRDSYPPEDAPEMPPGDSPRPKALMPCPAGGTPGLAYTEGSQHPLQTSAAPSPREEELEPQVEGEQADMEPITEQQLDGLDKFRNTLGVYIIVADLVYWRDTRTSALVFTGVMVTLLSLLHFSIVSVGSYGALAVLGITITLRLGRKGLQALRRSDGTNPFQAQLDADLPLSQEQLERLATQLSRDILAAAHTLRRLFLVEDLVDSIKFAFLFYISPYVTGPCSDGDSLLILGVISAFTFPLLYRQHQAQIDQYVGLVRNQLSNLRAKIQAKLPSAKAKPE
ncbi:reticulon-2 [Chelonoidis abingdonii]|uniref:reticulon-2 n=1 Tax=Chelonoidis abingdonii TaxID=106734 RepID=UPI003F49AE9C